MCELDQSRERKPGEQRFQDDWVLDPRLFARLHTLFVGLLPRREPQFRPRREPSRSPATLLATPRRVQFLRLAMLFTYLMGRRSLANRCAQVEHDLGAVGFETAESIRRRVYWRTGPTRPVSSVCRDLLRCQTVLNSTELNYFFHLCVLQDRAGGLCPCHKTSSSAEIRWSCRFC